MQMTVNDCYFIDADEYTEAGFMGPNQVDNVLEELGWIGR